MSETVEHTPGPWRVERGTTLVWGDCTITDDHPDHLGVPVADAQLARAWAKGEPTYERAEANARLIAAAPELLEVLKAYVAWEVEYMTINNLGDPEKQHNVKWARAVIAKATGLKTAERAP